MEGCETGRVVVQGRAARRIGRSSPRTRGPRPSKGAARIGKGSFLAPLSAAAPLPCLDPRVRGDERRWGRHPPLDRHGPCVTYVCPDVNYDVSDMITAAQLRAARALLGIDQRVLADRAGLSVPTIQRMEASEGTVRGNVDSLVKLVAALDVLGVALITAGSVSADGGRGVRLKQ